MSIVFETPQIVLHQGHCINILKAIPDESVDCVVTSPPYYGLRQYCPDILQIKKDLPPDQLAYLLSEIEKANVKPIAHHTLGYAHAHSSHCFFCQQRASRRPL